MLNACRAIAGLPFRQRPRPPPLLGQEVPAVPTVSEPASTIRSRSSFDLKALPSKSRPYEKLHQVSLV